jgi:hypothetical protein
MKPEKEAHIHIDGRGIDTSTTTSGHELYVLGAVKDDYDLYKEVHGHGDDELIANSAIAFTVKSGDQFYSAKRTLNPGA